MTRVTVLAIAILFLVGVPVTAFAEPYRSYSEYARDQYAAWGYGLATGMATYTILKDRDVPKPVAGTVGLATGGFTYLGYQATVVAPRLWDTLKSWLNR